MQTTSLGCQPPGSLAPPLANPRPPFPASPPLRYNDAVAEEGELPPEQRVVANVGKMDARKHLASSVSSVMASNINTTLGQMLDCIVF